MKWWPAPCVPGDLIRVRVGSIWHYGVYASEEEVIQFGLPPRQGFLRPDEVRVCASTMAEFAENSIVETARWTWKEKFRKNSARRAVALARSRIGEGGYNLLHNNCEHFAYECVLGEKRCEQEEKVSQQRKNRPLLGVFFMQMPENAGEDELIPAARMEEIRRTGHERVRREKYWVWKTLETAISQTFSQRMDQLTFKKHINGKWTAEGVYFSLTHAGGWVAAAVSNRPVGIDMEPLSSSDGRPWEKMAQRIASPKELEIFSAESREAMIALWTRKESAFKRSDALRFVPLRVDALAGDIRTLVLENGMLCSVCAEKMSGMHLYCWDETGIRDFEAREWMAK